MNKSTLISIIGFILLFVGMLSLIFSMVGMRFTFLSFLDTLGNMPSFLIKLASIVIGFVLIYISKSPEYQQKSKH